MKKIIKRISAVFLAALMILSVFIIPVVAETEALPEDIATSDVMSDLRAMGIDITKYQKDTNAEHVRILKFLEYGYDYSGDQSDYGLYIYVWNPTGKAIDTSSNLNKITIQARSVQITDESAWRKLPLEFVSVSTESGYQNLFYKFKVSSFQATALLKNVSNSLRVYEVSEIELRYSNNNAESFTVGGRYSYSGFIPYHGKDKANKANTLTCQGTDVTVIEIEINPTTWKTETSAKGVGYANELFSVYFSIPNDIIRDYGNTADKITKGLVKIEGEYSKHRINGLVVDNSSLYDMIYPHLGTKVYDEDVPFEFYSDFNRVSSHGVGVSYYENPFNVLVDTTYSKVIGTGDRAGVVINRLTSVIQADIYDKDDFVSSSQLREDLYDIWDDFGTRLYYEGTVDGYGPTLPGQVLDTYGDNLFYVVSAKDENGKYVDIADQIKVYSSNHTPSIWDKWFGNSLYNESSYNNIKSIQYIDVAVYDNWWIFEDDKTVSDHFYISERDVDAMGSFIATEALKNRSTFLMRFAVDDYYATEVDVIRKSTTGVSGDAIYFEKNIYLNVDVLSFTFENQFSEKVTLPVAADPKDNVGEITPTPKPDGGITINGGSNSGDSSFNEIKIIIALLAVIAFIAFLNWIFSLIGLPLSKVFKVIFAIIAFPFNLIGKLFKFGSDAASEKRKSDEHRWKREDRERKDGGSE